MKKLFLLSALVIFSFNVKAQFSTEMSVEDYFLTYKNEISNTNSTLYLNDSISFKLFMNEYSFESVQEKFNMAFPGYWIMPIESKYGIIGFEIMPDLTNENLELVDAKKQILKIKNKINQNNTLDTIIADEYVLVIFNKNILLSDVKSMYITDIGVENINELLENFF